MVQVLKEEIKQSVLDAAVKMFAKVGFKKPPWQPLPERRMWLQVISTDTLVAIGLI